MSRLLASVPGATFADGSVADVELWESTTHAPDATVFVGMALLTDSAGRCAVTYSPRRGEWAVPGGLREPGETVVECVVREVWEETGLRLDPDSLRPCGFEVLRPRSEGAWPEGGGALQLFRAALPGRGPDLVASEPDAVDPHWVSAAEFEELSGDRFWWPLVAAFLHDGEGAVRP